MTQEAAASSECARAPVRAAPTTVGRPPSAASRRARARPVRRDDAALAAAQACRAQLEFQQRAARGPSTGYRAPARSQSQGPKCAGQPTRMLCVAGGSAEALFLVLFGDAERDAVPARRRPADSRG